MDPQQRLFLQEAWHALEDAGYAGASIEGRRCGVYVGCVSGDYQRLLDERAPAQAFWGNAASIIPARIAYHLDLQGPAVAVDTACSSSLVALHQACQGLRSGEVELAIAGGVFVQSTAAFYLQANRAGMLSPTGRCHVFDAAADGFVPGEGVGAVVLKRLSRALADGDTIHGVILGTGINQDGATNGITAPSARSQTRLEREVYQRFGIEPSTIRMVEAHGTGTVLGDPIEFRALSEAFGDPGQDLKRCALGSIKSNLGHTAAAAGIAGVIKVLLALRHRKIPASLHFREPNPQIDFEHSPFYVPTELKDWEVSEGGQRRAAVSSFGFSGTNAHAVIGEGPQIAAAPAVRPAYLIVLSAKGEWQLREQVQQLVRYAQGRELDPGMMSYTLLLGRRHLEHRLACVAKSCAMAFERLSEWLVQGKAAGVHVGQVDSGKKESKGLERVGQRCLETCTEGLGPVEFEEALDTLAALYVQGVALPWETLFEAQVKRRISLPTYPFAPEGYWVPERSGGNAATASGRLVPLHPLVHRNSSELDEQRYSTTLSGEEFFVRDHVVQGRRIVPGVAQLEWARAALSLALGGENSIRLEQVKWLRPLVVESEQEVHIGLMEEADGRISYEIYSGQSDEAVVYSQGYGVVQRPGEPPQIDLTALLGQCARKLSSAEIYGNFESFGMNYGPSFQVLTELHIGQGLAMGDLELGPDPRPEGYTWLPSLLDGALQASIGVISAQTEPALPFAVQAVEQWAEVPSSAWAVVRAGKGDSAAVRKLDIAITDEEGRVAVQLSGFSTRPFEDIGTGAGSQTILAAPQWRQQAIPGPAQKELVYGAQWVLLCEVDPASTFELEVAPATCVRLKANGALEERYGSYAEQLLRQLKAIVESAPKTPVLLQLVVPGTDAMLQGLGALLRSAQQEYPMLIAQVVAVESVSDLALRLQAEALSPGPVVRYRPAGREVLTFTECESFSLSDAGSFSPSDATLPWRDAGVYWITGGTGGLGRLFAQAIAHQVKGPALVLSGRRALTPREEAFLEELRNQGAQVDYCAVNVGDGAAMRSLAQNIVAKFGRLNGVIHSAGVLGDRLFVNKSSEEFEQVLRPKVAGLVALDEATRDAALDWLVLCSS